jgi:predicted MFS family arabinose efflux permease
LSGVLVLALPDAAGWKSAWWIAAVLAGALSAVAWSLGPAGDGGGAASRSAPRINRHFVVLFVSYSLEGVGYIVAATFLVAAIRQGAAGWLANGAWLFVGLAAAPSAAVWAMLSRRWSHRSLLVAALALQAVGIALPAVATGAAPALIGAVLFGATFMGVSTVALSAGRLLQLPAAAALLTAGYSAGQILGPVSVTPLLANGFRTALIVAALVVVAAASAAALLRIPQRTPAR